MELVITVVVLGICKEIAKCQECFRISVRDIKAQVAEVVVDLVGPEVLEVAEEG